MFLRQETAGEAHKGITHPDEEGSDVGEKIDPFEALSRYSSRKPRDPEEAWIQSKINSWFKAEGELSLDRCFGVTYSRWCRFQRDRYLQEAALLVGVNGILPVSKKLEAEWSKFISRGPWNAWRRDLSPPPDAAPLNVALFWATLHNKSQSLTAKRIEQILKNIFTE